MMYLTNLPNPARLLLPGSQGLPRFEYREIDRLADYLLGYSYDSWRPFSFLR